MTKTRNFKNRKRISELETVVYDVRFMVEYDGEIYVMYDVESGQPTLLADNHIYRKESKARVKMDAKTGKLNIFIPCYMNRELAGKIKENLLKHGKSFMNVRDLTSGKHSFEVEFANNIYHLLCDLVDDILYVNKRKHLDYFCNGNIIQERKLLDRCEEIEIENEKRRAEFLEVFLKGNVKFVKPEEEE